MLVLRDVSFIIGGIFSIHLLGALVIKENKEEPGAANESASVKRESLHDMLKQIINPVLIVYFLSTVLWNIGFGLLLVLLYNYIATVFARAFWAGTAMTLYGTGVLIASVLMAGINLKFNTNKYAIQLTSLLLMGLVTGAMGFMNNVYAIVALTIVYGGMFGIVLSNIPNIVKHLNGPRSHDLMYAISQTCGGIGSLAGPPLVTRLEKTLPPNTFLFIRRFTSQFPSLLILVVVKRNAWQPFDENSIVDISHCRKTAEASLQEISFFINMAC